jgi:hypothetical protein
VYELNRAAVQDALPELLKDPQGKVLAIAQAKERFRFAALPPDVILTVYKWRLPQLWFVASPRLEGDAGPNQPVRDVSYLEAAAFAEWAGKHVVSEPEFEYAARGPEMRVYPWGSDWKDGVDPTSGKRVVESRCNWLDLGIVSERTREPTTVEVDKMPEGRSWCGAYHMLGNAAEWTSTWFNPYPGWNGSTDIAVNRWASYHGAYVKVVRGGSCADRERLALRNAYRNFIGIERSAPPQPENHFAYTGFRCAYYLTPCLDRLESAITRLLKPKKVRRELVAADLFGGASAVRFAPTGAEVENHVHVLGKASAILVAPLTALQPDPKEKAAVDTREELLAFAPDREHPDPLPIGVFHTDIAIEKAKLRDPKAPPEEAGRRRKKSTKEDSQLPPTIEGTLPPGTYVLGLSHGHIGVYESNLTFVAFLDKSEITARKLKKDEARPWAKVDPEPDADKVGCSLWIATGGKGKDASEGFQISFRFFTESGQLDKAGSWRTK